MPVLRPIMLDLHAFIQKLADELHRDINELFQELNVPNHPADHAYEEDPQWPGTCRHCHWISEEVVCKQCMFPAREHAGFVSLGSLLEGLLDAVAKQRLAGSSRRYREN